MCLCDDKYFKVVDIKTGKEKLYKRVASISRRFKTLNEFILRHYIPDRAVLRHNGECYKVELNRHPECQILRRKTIKYFGHRPSYLPPAKIQQYKDAIIKRELAE